jgi:Metal-dependent amidase/aminoacylase/carboxypeptidase
VFFLGEKLLGKEHVLLRESPSMGGEDFSYFVREAKGAFYHLGCASKQPAPTLHSADFVPDERCMPIGIALQTALALQMA